MEKTQIVSCGCKHKFQDETYGSGQRVTTPNNKEQAKKNLIVRCTVCSREHNIGMLK